MKLSCGMFSVGDFDQDITAEKCLQNVIQSATDGSIIVFHDSLKTYEKLQYVLPRVLDHYSSLGYSFENLGSAIYKEKYQEDIKTA